MKATDKANLIDRIKTLEGLTDDERSALLGLLRESKTTDLCGRINLKSLKNVCATSFLY